MLPPDRRRDRFAAEVDAMVREDFAGRVLPFDSTAAEAYGAIAAARRSVGRPILEAGNQISAVARVAGAAVATRNRADFEYCGISLVDPWTDCADRADTPRRRPTWRAERQGRRDPRMDQKWRKKK
jgi:hypothetical protein